MKNYLFFTNDGYTFDKENKQTHNMQILGDGFGDNVEEALKSLKRNQQYLSTHSYINIYAVQTVGEVIRNLEL